ncbi:metal-dependent hydrolase [Paenibacillus montanisoli]|uniref:Metal-dependent hydrolase n=1 Tax=Paenibacillus montanisoli TaxID=2081970 RepID=A0A328U0Y2_9BACL|nr:metal-dependent hydrolase [Paenibacillus montanisoli]RAP75413.1 metal-dependent hydrolase [Paenibacillus montanisoli]
MKGTTHLAIGAAIGVVAAATHPITVTNAAAFILVAAFSALSADLDGTNLLSGKLSKAARLIRVLMLWGGVFAAGATAYLYAAKAIFYPYLSIAAAVLLLLGLISSNGAIRNGLVSLIGAVLLYAGYAIGQGWLMGLGLFVAWVPWLNHRGLTHTVWAVIAWGAIGWGLERELGIDGIMTTAICGYVSHLVADTLTPSGVKWLYPLSKRTFKLPFG